MSFEDTNGASLLLAPRGNVPSSLYEEVRLCASEGTTDPAYWPLMCLELEAHRYIRSTHTVIKGKLNLVRTALHLNPYLKPQLSGQGGGSDLVEFMRRLTLLAQEVSGLKFCLRSDLQILSCVRNMHDLQKEACLGATVGAKRRSWLEINDRLLSLKANLEELSERMVLREAEVQNLMQTLYNLIGVRDNALNYKAAEASVRLTEATSQDSADMRVIAAVTLVFLPATFVATFFSTSFFDFQKTTTGFVSSWIWLYCAITIGLSALVLTAWAFTSRHLRRQQNSARREQKDVLEAQSYAEKSSRNGSRGLLHALIG